MPKLIRLRVVRREVPDELYDVVVVAGMTAGWLLNRVEIQSRRLVRDSDRREYHPDDDLFQCTDDGDEVVALPGDWDGYRDYLEVEE
ncbi:MAG: hypothetical protein ABSB22_12695 [Thermodesulfobacteriota bacterium]|jgi:hypothetical protein